MVTCKALICAKDSKFCSHLLSLYLQLLLYTTVWCDRVTVFVLAMCKSHNINFVVIVVIVVMLCMLCMLLL